ncbi:MAG: porin [Mesorhizobium sp.]
MNIKGLLLGSVAALVAVSGARAADAVMAPEPEPVEYVRVCDAYGAGFFYIPGTETCLQVSGYVWYQIGASSHMVEASAVSPGTVSNAYGMAGDGWEKSIEARVNFDARSETEWGTLRSYIRLQASWNGVGDGPVEADQAFIQLGGFTMGYTDSFWVDSQDGNASNWGSHSWHGMYYGDQQRALIGYTFSSNGFFGAIALEDDAVDGEGYMPDVVAKLGYTAGWGTVWVKVAYDESFDGSVVTQPPGVAGAINDGGWAAQIGAQFNIPNLPGSSLRVIGFWADGAHQYNVGSPTVFYGGGVSLYGGSEWSVLASYNHQFSETLGASIAFQYFNNLYYAGSDITRGQDAWSAELSVVWLPVTNFEVRAELHYDDIDSYPAIVGLPGDPDGTVSGFLRFTRYF